MNVAHRKAAPVRTAAPAPQPHGDRELLAFLPAVLEITDTPPHPLGRALLWTLLALLAVMVTWAVFGRLDTVAVAAGRVIARGYDKPIQPMEQASVQRIHVRDGEHVEAGQPLIELDPALVLAERERLHAEAAHFRRERERLATALARIDAPEPPAAPERTDAPAQQAAPDADTQTRWLHVQLAEHRARLAALDAESQRLHAALAASRARAEKLAAQLPLVSERAAALKTLADQKLSGRHAWLETEAARITTAQDLAAERAGGDELRAQAERNRRERHALDAAFRGQWLERLAEAERQLASLEQEARKTGQRLGWYTLRAPVAGTVHRLAVHTPGAVVTPAQTLLVIVPDDAQLEVEASLANLDRGFVVPGQNARVKVETFTFTRYGTLAGTVTQVAADAVARTENSSELVFPTRVHLARQDMEIDGHSVALAPGMNVTVEIRTGQRRVIEFLLSPIMKRMDESGKER